MRVETWVSSRTILCAERDGKSKKHFEEERFNPTECFHGDRNDFSNGLTGQLNLCSAFESSFL